jgi:Family of unknown function (DUF5681)
MSKKHSNSGSKTSEVGYGRPPKRYQFKPGQIANPEGINRKAPRSPDFKASLERELRKPISIERGKRKVVVTQEVAGIGELVRQFAKGEHRARRDLVLLCDKYGVDLNRNALRGALEDALCAEDEALLAEFVKRHGGQYPPKADVFSTNTKDAKLLTSPNKDAKLLSAPAENSPQLANRSN